MLTLNMKTNEALSLVQQAITLDTAYISEVIHDDDLISNKEIVDFINNKVLPFIDSVNDRLQNARKYCIPETKETQELHEIIASFNYSYVEVRKIMTNIESTNLITRIYKTNEAFFEACEEFEKGKKSLTQSILRMYDEDKLNYENDFKSEYKWLCYFPTNYRFYVEKDLMSNHLKAYHTVNDKQYKDIAYIGALRATITFINKLEVFDYRWFEWVYENELNTKKFSSIAKIGDQGKCFLVIKRNLHHYAFYFHSSFGFSIYLITSDGYLVEIGFDYTIQIIDPLKMLEKYEFGNYPIQLSIKTRKSHQGKIRKSSI